MSAIEIVDQLKMLGQESYKKVLLKHDIKEPLLGVKIEELKKIAKANKGNHELALELYATGIYDAMYLAGLMVEPKKMTAADLQTWAQNASAPVLREYTVAWVAAESNFGMQMAKDWIRDADAHIQSAGWSVLSSQVAITPDSDLDISFLDSLITEVSEKIHHSANRVKLAMNGFVIAVGLHVAPLSARAREIALLVGKVEADMGDTACKIPSAPAYIDKGLSKFAAGRKMKSVRCL